MAVLLPVGLILKEPNLGTAFITGVIGFSIILAAGMRLWQVALLLLPAAAAWCNFAYAHLHDYQRARITTFMNPESDPLGAGYNIIQSKIALGSGGMWGKGFMQGTQAHLNFLPEKQTDFIFLHRRRGMGSGRRAGAARPSAADHPGRHGHGRAVPPPVRPPARALGIGVNMFMYVFVNVAMVVGAIPVGGVPLPLVSHGGSAMLTVMFAMGLLMSVHVHRNVEFANRNEEI